MGHYRQELLFTLHSQYLLIEAERKFGPSKSHLMKRNKDLDGDWGSPCQPFRKLNLRQKQQKGAPKAPLGVEEHLALELKMTKNSQKQ